MTGEAKQWVAVTVLVFRGQRLLAMKRASTASAGRGLWEGISGRVRPGEEPQAAASREALEESGLSVELESTPVDAYAAERNGEPMTVVVFRGESEHGEVVLSDEHDAHQWCTLTQFAELGAPERLVRAARRAWRASGHNRSND